MAKASPSIKFFQNIIKAVWELPLTPDERVQFMTGSRLVSKTWHAEFEKVAAIDMHIPCESFYRQHFHNRYHHYSDCERITFTVYDPKNLRPTTRNLAYMRKEDMEQLTSVHTYRFNYHDTTYPDPYTQGFMAALPDFLPKLSISYTFSPETPPYFVAYYRKHFEREWRTRFANPHVGLLEVDGASKYIAAVWESLFPDRAIMVKDGKERRQRKPLMRIESRFDAQMGLLHLMLLRQMREEEIRVEAARKRKAKRASRVRPLEMNQVQVNSISMLSARTANVPADVIFPPVVCIGDVGYMKGSTFCPIFNARAGIHKIPALQHTDVKTIRLSDGTCRRCREEILEHPREWTCDYCRGGNLKEWLTRYLAIHRESREIECFDPKNDGGVRKWFETNFQDIVTFCEANLYVSVENLMLVTGITH